jgi:hypothetical protein
VVVRVFLSAQRRSIILGQLNLACSDCGNLSNLSDSDIHPGMATSYEHSSLAERTDIHKSCKSLETLLNVLNDYCEAIGNVSALQKKLAKALRETAGMKITGEIAGLLISCDLTRCLKSI